MTDLADLVEMEFKDAEMQPEILSVDARLSIKGPVSVISDLFARAASVSPTKEFIAGTGNVLLEAFEGGLDGDSYIRITATDGSQTLAITAGGVIVNRAGAVLLPPRRILDILKLAPTETVRLDVLTDTATLVSGRALWTVQTPTGDSLPPLPSAHGIQLHSVPREALLKALTVVRPAVAQNNSRPALMQALVADGKITASDGGRIHRFAVPGMPLGVRMAIPRATVEELVRALRASDAADIALGADETKMVFRLEGDTLIAQRLLVDFPSVENLVLAPAFANQHTLIVDSGELREVVARVRVNADPDYAAIFLALVPGKKDADGTISHKLAVRARDRTGNASQELLDCQWFGPEKSRELCVNHKNLTEFIAAYGEEKIAFKIGDDTKTQRFPLFIEEGDFTGVLMQMRSEFFG